MRPMRSKINENWLLFWHMAKMRLFICLTMQRNYSNWLKNILITLSCYSIVSLLFSIMALSCLSLAENLGQRSRPRGGGQYHYQPIRGTGSVSQEEAEKTKFCLKVRCAKNSCYDKYYKIYSGFFSESCLSDRPYWNQCKITIGTCHAC